METVEKKVWTIEMGSLEVAAECLKTIAHPCRLRMIDVLLEGEFTVGQLANFCSIQNHMASEHLGLMKDRGLLKCERRGREVYYSIERNGLEQIVECIRKYFG